MSKRVYVTVTDTDGVVWLNTGSFETDSPQEFARCLGGWILELRRTLAALGWR